MAERLQIKRDGYDVISLSSFRDAGEKVQRLDTSMMNIVAHDGKKIPIRVLVVPVIAKPFTSYSVPLVHIFPYFTNNLFITYALLSQINLITFIIIIVINNLKNNIFIKQTKIEIQNENKPIVATSVSKAVT